VGARRRLLRWGSWFALVNAGVLALVGLRYLWYYAAVGPSVAWIYAPAAFVGQMAVFAFVPFLLLLPVILLVPWPRIIVPLGVCLGSTVLSFLVLDGLLFSDSQWEWLITLSHNDFALLEPDQVTIVYPSGNEVRDQSYRLVQHPRLSHDKVRAAMQEMSRFFN